jgi:bifunctional non-homologous end joining protein LigD
MQARAAARKHPARLYLFDLLARGRRDVRKLPLIVRKDLLRESFEDNASAYLPTGFTLRANGCSSRRKNATLKASWRSASIRPIKPAAVATG